MSGQASLIRGTLRTGSDVHTVHSLFSKEPIGKVGYFSGSEVRVAFQFARERSHHITWSTSEVFPFLQRLSENLDERRSEVIQMLCTESGFVRRDGEDLIDQGISFLREYKRFFDEQCTFSKDFSLETASGLRNPTRIVAFPYGVVAAVLPANAVLQLILIIIANSLAAGNQLVIRPSSQSTLIAGLLSELIHDAIVPGNAVQIINCDSRDLVREALIARVDLLHFFGSSQLYPTVSEQCASAGVNLIYEGQGNVIAVVAENASMADSLEICKRAAIRFNGETCTSINGILVPKDTFSIFVESLQDSFDRARTGDPKDLATEVGPLFSENQIAHLLNLVKDADATCPTIQRSTPNLMSPLLITRVTQDSQLAREGFFAPAVWISAYENPDEIIPFLRKNVYPICHTVFTSDLEAADHLSTKLSNIAKIVINEDPSREVFAEPWGAYGHCGNGKVSTWLEKYTRTVQIQVK